MIEQSVEEVAEAMKDDPKAWAEQYIDLMAMCCQLQQHNQQLLLQLPDKNQAGAH